MICKLIDSLYADDLMKMSSTRFSSYAFQVCLKQLDSAYELANEHSESDGSPNTVRGMVQGITRLSQQSLHADARARLDRAAGKVLQIAF
jgi:hypothetical protein